MKIVPLAAVLIGALGSVANAQSAVSDVPAFNLAMNTVVASQWVAAKAPRKAGSPVVNIVDTNVLVARFNQDLAKKLDADTGQIGQDLADRLKTSTMN